MKVKNFKHFYLELLQTFPFKGGKMEDLDNKWILHSGGADCSDSDDNSPATLGLDNMRGVFILVGVGIVGGMALIVIEIIYKKHQMRKQKRASMARTAISKWRGTLEVNLVYFITLKLNLFCEFLCLETPDTETKQRHEAKDKIEWLAGTDSRNPRLCDNVVSRLTASKTDVSLWIKHMEKVSDCCLRSSNEFRLSLSATRRQWTCGWGQHLQGSSCNRPVHEKLDWHDCR